VIRDERGITLVEVMVAATIGTVVMLGLLGLLDATTRVSARVTARADSGMRGREAMEQMVQLLRASVCMKQAATLTPIDSASDTSVTFYADIAHPSGTGTDDFIPQKFQLSLSGGTLTQTTWTGAGTYADPTTPLTFSGAGATRPVLANVRAKPGVPIFSFYAYNGSTAPDPYNGATALTSPLSAADLAKVAMVRIAFVAGPLGKVAPDPKSDTALDEIVRLRQVNPEDNPAGGAVCLV
jgi:Flp pilus assembly pilin Flp